MKNTAKRMLAILLAAIMLGTAASCTGSGNPADTTDTAGSDSTQAVTDETATETAPETQPLPEDFVVTEEGGTASVMTPAGLTYTVTGYTAVNEGAFTFADSLSIHFAEQAFEEEFNRFTMHYSSDQPLQIFVTYGDAKEEYFYLEAGTKDFSALISTFMDKEYYHDITDIRVESCVDGAASFSLTSLTTEQREAPEETTVYVENGRYKLGVALHMGGGINYLEDKKDGDLRLASLINQHDAGRLLQQSYYGVMENDEYKPGNYNGTPWCYNPVQGGNVKGDKSRIIDFVVSDNKIYVKAQPTDWGAGISITPSYMENTYTLYEDRVQVDNRFVDFSGWKHRYASQELPAFYTVSYLQCFSLYNGTKPWTGDTLSYRDDLDFWGSSAYHGDCSFSLRESNTETWCAWTNKRGTFGIGLYVPNVDSFLAGRFIKDDISKSAMDNPCCYVAPLKTIILTAFEPLEYSYLVATGSLEDIRKTFTDNKDFASNEYLNKYSQPGRIPDDALVYNEYKYGQEIQVPDPISANLDLTKEANCKHVSSTHCAEVLFSTEQGATILRVTGDDPYVSIPYAETLSADTYKKIKITYMIPTTNSSNSYLCDVFFCAGDIGAATGDAVQRHGLIVDGEYHTLEVDLSGEANWKGSIHSIRFDFFDGCAAGDIMYVKSVVLE